MMNKIILNIIITLSFSAILFPVNCSAQTRHQKTKEVYVWSRIQSKYGLYNNFLHYWLDRPLLFDRSLRPVPWQVNTYPSFKKMIEQMADYHLDGVGVLIGCKGKLHRYSLIAKYTEKANIPGFHFIPETGIIPEANPQAKLDTSIDELVLKTAQQSKTALKINGKILLASYAANLATPEKWRCYLDKLRQKTGDNFLFIAGIGCSKRSWQSLRNEFETNNNSLKPATIKECKKYIQSYLDVADGVLFAGGMRGNFNKKYYQTVVRIFKEVLQSPKYQNKYFGLSAKIGYINKFTSSILWEDGTKTLRGYLDAALKAKPDLILLPEWNEVNECTSFQPTVMRSFATKRILRYYIDTLKHKKLSPLKNDDISIPNIIINYRYCVKLGEKISFELLNIPDGTYKKKYTVKLSLLDASGKITKSFPAIKFDGKKLKSRTYNLISENYSRKLILQPVLQIIQNNKLIKITQGLRHIDLKATANVNRLCYEQPIRDLLKTKSCKFKVTKTGKKFLISGEIEGKSNLTSVEVIRNGHEIFSVDPQKEFGSKDKMTTLFVYYTSLKKDRKFKMEMKVLNSDFKLHPLLRADNIFTNYSRKGSTVDIRQFTWCNRHGFFLTIPKGNITAAQLQFSSGKSKFIVPVADIIKRKVYSKTFNGFIRLCFKDYDLLPDLPQKINASKVNFNFSVDNDNKNNCFHLRVIDNAGKIWRSSPFIFKAPAKGKICLNVDSYSFNKITKIITDKNRIPFIKYIFKRDDSSTLYCSAGSEWFAELGGGTEYGQPFHRTHRFPSNAPSPKPTWRVEDGYECLKFDGVGNYINFPMSTIPRGEFTVEMDIKPSSKKKQLLLACHGKYRGPFMLTLKNEKLSLIYHGRVLPGEKYMWLKAITLKPIHKVPCNKWTNIKIVNDLKHIKILINNKVCAKTPCDREAFGFSPVVFGGIKLKNDFNGFKGYLKSISFKHSAN